MKDLDKMLKNLEGLKPESNFKFKGELSLPEKRARRLPFYRSRMFYPITAAVLAAVITLMILLPISPDNITPNAPQVVYTPLKPNISYVRPPESSVDTLGLPWENGTLKLTTLSTSAPGRNGGIIPLSNRAVIESQNIDLSFLGNTKIVSCSDGNLVRINTQTGDHAGCRGLYFNVYDGSIFCVACAIKESVKCEPYYIDACVRALIEECIFTADTVKSAHEVEYLYTILIDTLYKNGANEVFMRGEQPTVEGLGLDLSVTSLFDSGVAERIAQYKYPVINVLEFGMSSKYCLYGIASSRSGATWGNFKMDLTTGEVISLNGDEGENLKNGGVLYNHTASPYFYNGMTSADLGNFTSIDVSTDYTFAVVTAPFFRYESIPDIDNGMILKTNFNEQNVYYIDLVSGKFIPLLGEKYTYVPENLTDRPYPLQPAQIVDGLVCFPTKRDTWYFYYGVANEFSGELLKVCTYSGIKYAVMLQGDDTVCYRLGDGADVTEDILSGETVLPEGFETTSSSVSVGNSSVSVWTKDGKYKYSYLKGEDKINCVEIASGETGEIPVSKEFLDRVSGLDAVQYYMFADPNGTRLILSYFDISGIRFNRSELYNDPCYVPQYNGFRMDYIEVNRYAGHFYDVNGRKIEFYDKANIFKAMVALSYDGINALVEQYVINDASPEKYSADYRKDYFAVISAACDKIALELDYDGEKAKLSDEALNRLLGGVEFDEYLTKYDQMIDRQYK